LRGTHRDITANRQDIILKNIRQKTCTVMDVLIPVDRNVMQKEAERKLKYKSLYVEMQRMWNMKYMNILVIIGATRTVTIGLK
jgi:hypothetical protein